jgi:hypothetical protein
VARAVQAIGATRGQCLSVDGLGRVRWRGV